MEQFIHIENEHMGGFVSIVVLSWRSDTAYFGAATLIQAFGYINPEKAMKKFCRDRRQFQDKYGTVTCISKRDVKRLVKYAPSREAAFLGEWLFNHAEPYAVKAGQAMLLSCGYPPQFRCQCGADLIE
ncbi:hypothetical protein [Endozoicomonas atrinae]|uniref:hypothetical protein n=1 Tax=Endozoicomonas atrinae TaxID=1333660 RepID=UPI003B00DBEF